MEKVFSIISGFLSGLGSLFMAFIPVTILWYVLTGGTVFGMDVIANLTALITGLGNGGLGRLAAGYIILSNSTSTCYWIWY